MVQCAAIINNSWSKHHPLINILTKWIIFIIRNIGYILAIPTHIGDNLTFCDGITLSGEFLLLNVSIKDPVQKPQACIIWLHGLGASADDMAGLAEQLPLSDNIRHVLVDAPVRPVTINQRMPMRAWYDIIGPSLNDREDREGILESKAFIMDVINSQIAEGFDSKKIFLAGFSQGGAMALFTGLQMPSPLAGIIALSAYLPLSSICPMTIDLHTPIFFAIGQHDPIVLPQWSRLSLKPLLHRGFSNISQHEYPIEHTVCLDELYDLSRWIHQQIASINPSMEELK